MFLSSLTIQQAVWQARLAVVEEVAMRYASLSKVLVVHSAFSDRQLVLFVAIQLGCRSLARSGMVCMCPQEQFPPKGQTSAHMLHCFCAPVS